MIEPTRLLHGGGSELERTLLEAAQDERPSAAGMRRAAVALAAATGVSTFTKWTWAAQDLLKPLTTLTGKLVAGAVLVGSGAILFTPGSPLASEESRATSAPHAPLPALTDAEPAAPDAGASQGGPAGAIQVTAPHQEATAAKTPATPPPPNNRLNRRGDKPSLADETKALDAARKSLDSGAPLRALNQLDAYARDYRRGLLGQEAMVMRIRALTQAGRSSEAQSLAARFRASHPQSPYNKRIDSIVGEQTMQ